MKRCPECRRDYYDDSLRYCLDDGSALLEGPASGDAPTAFISGDAEPATRHFQTSLRSSPRKNRMLSGVAVALAIGGTGVGLAVYKYRTPSDMTSRSIRIERVTTDGETTTAAISPDGKYAVYNIDSGGAQSLWTRQIATGSPVEIVPSAENVEYRSVRFSPDGSFVTFLKRDPSSTYFAAYQIPVLGGVQKKLADRADGGVTFSPDGRSIAYLRGNFPGIGESSIVLANSDGTNERVIATRKRPETFPWWPIGTSAFSPDGESVATVIGGNASGGVPMQVAEVKIADGTINPVGTDGWYEIFQVAWLPDKSGLLVIGAEKASDFHSQQIFLVSYPSGEKRRITTDLNMYLGVGVTADGKTIAAIQNNRVSNIWLAPNGDASRAEQIRSGGINQEGVDGLALAADGRVVFYSRASGGDDIWIMNGDGSGVKRLTIDAEANYDLKVTPDGRYVVFTSERAGQPNIWRMDIDGGNPRQLTFGTSEYGATITPDSKWIYFDSTSSGAPAIWKVSIDGGEPIQVFKGLTENAEVSPDGRKIACHFRDSAGAQVRFAIFDIEGGEPVKLLELPAKDMGEVFRWTPDSRALTYVLTNRGVANIWAQPIDGGPARQLTNFKNDLMFNFAWVANGKDMVLARGNAISDVVLIHDF